MPAPTPSPPEDQSTLTAVWRLVVDAWPRAADLADVLRVSESCVRMRSTGARLVAWADLRAALRRTARHRPEHVAELVEGLALELLDVRGSWHPAASASGSIVGELLDVHGSMSRLHGQLQAALADGHLDEGELAAIREALRDQRQQLAELEAAVGATHLRSVNGR